MAFTKGTLSLLFQTLEGGQKWWAYSTADSLATVLGAGYVTSAADYRMQIGDIVWVFSGAANATGLNEGAEAFPVTVGLESLFTAAPALESCMVSSITAGAATLIPTKTSVLTDGSGGVANQTTGVAAQLAQQTVILPVQNIDDATGTLKLALPYAFQVTGTPQYRVAKPATTAAKAATATLQVSGVAATGGVISLTSANCTPMGAAVAASAAVTAGGVGVRGGTVEFAFSAVTAFIEGDGWFEVTVINQDLANAIASLIKF